MKKKIEPVKIVVPKEYEQIINYDKFNGTTSDLEKFAHWLLGVCAAVKNSHQGDAE